MRPISVLVRVLAVLLVAVPFGPGGICCCAGRPAAADLAAAATAPERAHAGSACCRDAGSAATTASAPTATDRDAGCDPSGSGHRDDCDCPARRSGVKDGTAPLPAAPDPSPAPVPALATACPADVAPTAPAPTFALRGMRARAPAPPGRSLHRLLSVERC